MASKYSKTDFITSMDDSDLELYNAAELWSPANMETQNCEVTNEMEVNYNFGDETPKKKVCISLSSSQIETCVEKVSSFNIEQTVDKIPPEILRQIFFNLPISDLLLSANCVCRRFHEIISDPTFLKYKKLYFMYRAEVKSAETDVKHNIIGPNRFLLQLDKAFSSVCWSTVYNEFPKLKEQQFSQLTERLSRLPHYETVCSFLQSNLLSQSCFENPTTWNYVCVLILLCDDVSSIKSLLYRLTRPPEIINRMVTVEFFYCVLLHVTAVNKHLNIMSRLCYNIYYALYLFENRQNNFMLTYEQQRIVNYDLDLTKSDFVRIMAFAGTGKTTTLIEYIKNRPQLQFLVIFYNKSLQEAAQKKFKLDNAVFRTMHSIAYEACKIKTVYDEKKRRRLELFNSDLREMVKNGGGVTGIPIVSVATLIKKTFTNFLSSDDEKIANVHAPQKRRCCVRKKSELDVIDVDITDEQKDQLVEYANEVWVKMRNPQDTSIPITHDGYLKMYQLSKPKFTDLFPNLDIILVDEAQDCNPTSIDIIRRQKQPKIIVGDKHQQIYSFRGSKNALDMFGDKKTTKRTFYLTQSFRFGPEVAYVANCWLKEAKKETKRTIVGVEKDSLVHVCQQEGPVTIICRKNAEVFSESACIAGLNPTPKLYIVGGIESLNFDLLEDLYYLSLDPQYHPAQFKSGRIKTLLYFGKCKRSLKDIEEFAVLEMDTQLQMQIEIVKKFNMSLLDVIKRIRNCFTYDNTAQPVDYTVTTVHKAKGIEFNTVRIMSDFMELEEIRLQQAEEIDNGQAEDEYNLPYVAMTRAQNFLSVSKQILNVMLMNFPDFLFCLKRVDDLSDSFKIAVETTCLMCNAVISVPSNKNELILYRKPVALSHGHKKPLISRDGVICKSCCSPFKIQNEVNDKIFFYDEFSRVAETAKIYRLREICIVFSQIYK